MAPEISLVIATYDRAGPLARVLEDVERQTLDASAFEVVVCVDGSTDTTAQVLQAWTERARFRLVTLQQENRGQARARDNAIRHAAGARIAIVDDDMELSESFLEEHLRAAAHDPERLVVLGKITADDAPEGKPLYEALRDEHMLRGHPQFESGAKSVDARGFATGNVSMPRTLYDAAGGFDPAMRLDEDRDLGVRLERAGGRLVFAKDARAVHRSDMGSYEVWERQQYEYGAVAVRIWEKYARDPYVHPLRNFVEGSVANHVAVRLLSRWDWSARAGSRVLRRTGECLDRTGMHKPALATHKAILAIQYHLGVKHGLGSWSALLAAARDFEQSANRPGAAPARRRLHRLRTLRRVGWRR
jgi:glycosyltransferase involved in cell wall biosynthesis